MLEDSIPTIDRDNAAADTTTTRNKAREEHEFEFLKLSAGIKKLQHREIGQRYWLRWIAVVLGVFVILGMSAVLVHVVHQLLWRPFVFVSSPFSVALVAGPILSITSVTIALFVGAFRKFDEKDMDMAASGAVAGIGLLKGA